MPCRTLLLALAALPSCSAMAATLDLKLTGTNPGLPVIVAVCRGGLADSQCRIVLREEGALSGSEERQVTVPPGRYAVVAFEDANRNGRLDTFLGLPTERYGLSNEVGRFAPPLFDRAAVTIPERGARVRVRLARLGQPG